MFRKNHVRWVMLIVFNIATICVLGFYRPSAAAPSKPIQPFANSVQQRLEMIQQLTKMNQLLQEQNDLLVSGKVRVVVTPQGR